MDRHSSYTAPRSGRMPASAVHGAVQNAATAAVPEMKIVSFTIFYATYCPLLSLTLFYIFW